MIRRLGLAIAALTLVNQPTAAADKIRFANIEGWKVETVAADPALKVLFDGSQYVFFVEDQEAEDRPVVRVRALADAGKLDSKNVESWKERVFFDKSQSQIITAQKVFKKEGRHHYVAEFQTDTGAATMLHSIVLATVVNGKIHVLTYEQRRDEYRKNIVKVKDLFQRVSVK